ncbi:hypothetical protein D3C85_71150 [compost metagenome]
MRLEAQALRGGSRPQQLLRGPGCARSRVATHVLGRKAVEQRIVSGMDGDQLALQMRRQFRYLQTVARQQGDHVVAVLLAGRRLLQVEQTRRRGELQALVTEAGRPLRQVLERVERRLIAEKLGQENGRALDGFHVNVLLTQTETRGRTLRVRPQPLFWGVVKKASSESKTAWRSRA